MHNLTFRTRAQDHDLIHGLCMVSTFLQGRKHKVMMSLITWTIVCEEISCSFRRTLVKGTHSLVLCSDGLPSPHDLVTHTKHMGKLLWVTFGVSTITHNSSKVQNTLWLCLHACPWLLLHSTKAMAHKRNQYSSPFCRLKNWIQQEREMRNKRTSTWAVLNLQ